MPKINIKNYLEISRNGLVDQIIHTIIAVHTLHDIRYNKMHACILKSIKPRLTSPFFGGHGLRVRVFLL